jgi:hypothetical protein
MKGPLAFSLKDLEKTITAALAVIAGNTSKVISSFDEQIDLKCSALKAEVEELKSVTKARRAELHFKAANYRDMRHSLLNSQAALRHAMWNRMRDPYETSRAVCPLELYEED